MEDISKADKILKDKTMEIAQFMFTKSQENLVRPVEWGDEKYSGQGKKASIISDTGILLKSGIPPYFEGNRVVFEYKNPIAVYVEYGTPPHAVGARRFIGWVNRKMGKSGKEALSICYAIATKIRRFGMPPHSFLRSSISTTVTHFKLEKL